MRTGKVRYVGCSNYPAWQLALSLGISERHGWSRYDCLQPRYNLLFRDIEAELLPLCRDQGIGVIAFNPLAGGFLTGKYRGKAEAEPEGFRFTTGRTGELYRERYWQKTKFDAVDHLVRFFEPRGKPLVQVAVAWVLQQPGITSAIVGASKPEQLDQSLPAVSITLDKDEKEACDLAWYSMPRPRKRRRKLSGTLTQSWPNHAASMGN